MSTDADSAPKATDEQQRQLINARTTGAGMKNSSGWDGKLRVERNAVIANSEALEDPDYTDEDAPPPDQIEADEGTYRN
jgi:hypothetical protein